MESEGHPPINALIAVHEDEIELAKKRGVYEEFKTQEIENMDKQKRGIGRWLRDGMRQASTPEDADLIFETAYIFFGVRDVLNNPIDED